MKRNNTKAKLPPAVLRSKKIFPKLDAWMEKHSRHLLIGILLVASILSLLMFDAKISTGGDDSLYVHAGYDYMTQGSKYYFNANAPLYPMILALVMLVTGFHLILFKTLSILFFLASIILIYYTFERRIPYSILFSILAFQAVNYYFLYHASQTYTESFFIMMQALFFLAARYLIDALGDKKKSFYQTWKPWLLFGMMLFLLAMSKNVAITALVAAILYFLIRKEFVYAVYTVGAFSIFRVSFEFLKRLIWGNIGQYSTQLNILLQKNPYDASQGNENFGGFIQRLIDNTIIYWDRLLFQILGFSDEGDLDKPLLAIIIVVLIAGALIVFWKEKNKLLLFTGTYVIALCGATFLVVQPFWGQLRLVLVVVPFMLMLIFMFGYWFFNKPKCHGFQWILILLMLTVLFGSISETVPHIEKNYPIIRKNLAGDMYFGFTPDWVNYLRMCEWAADSLPSSSFVACRKPEMAFIYGKGKSFYGIYNVPTQDPDTILARFKSVGVTHVIDANLRTNPNIADGVIISTVRRTIMPIYQKYPEKLKLVHIIGQSEPAYIFELKN